MTEEKESSSCDGKGLGLEGPTLFSIYDELFSHFVVCACFTFSLKHKCISLKTVYALNKSIALGS